MRSKKVKYAGRDKCHFCEREEIHIVKTTNSNNVSLTYKVCTRHIDKAQRFLHKFYKGGII